MLNECLTSTEELSRIQVPAQHPSSNKEEKAALEHPEPCGNRPLSSPLNELKEKDVKVKVHEGNGYVDEDVEEKEEDQGWFEEEDYSVPVDLETNLYQVKNHLCPLPSHPTPSLKNSASDDHRQFNETVLNLNVKAYVVTTHFKLVGKGTITNVFNHSKKSKIKPSIKKSTYGKDLSTLVLISF